jgi:hypothetical protein
MPDPGWFDAMMTVAMGLGVTREGYERLFREAVAAQPGYTAFYLHKAYYLLPRWYGQEGEWQRFAAEVRAAHGVELYARIGWAQGAFEGFPQMFKARSIVWSDMKAGYEEMLRRNPGSVWTMNCLARVAWAAGDRETSARMFERIGDDYYSTAWQSRAMFDDYRARALGAAKARQTLPESVPLRVPGK